MDIIDLTTSSPAILGRTTAATRGRSRPPRPTPASRVNAAPPRPSAPQPRRQLRVRPATASSSGNSLGTTPTNTGSLASDSPGLFLRTESDSSSDDSNRYDDSMEEYLQINEAYISSDDSSDYSSIDVEATDEDDEDSDDSEEDEGEDIEPEHRRRLQTSNNVPAPSRPHAVPQTSRAAQVAAPQQQQTQQTSLKRSHSETEMPTKSSPEPKKAKTEAVEVVDMINIDDDDDFQKIMHEQMIKTQREEGNARRKIADFKCVICLDDPENLSATPCGHLFCNECIKTTLRFGRPTAKLGKCPVCRGKVAIREIVPLELKLIKRVEGKGKGKA
ncbi:SUMO-targeted ubiquitin ligase complex subunit slx8 [Orbilia blumenaviensis]|uniref:SUMO-targeted ubiquitin ligase complex subunit slx8 n=1 Tax=Orbilia blumenaviensis TaxID=1796055 RepID=A0AAV9VKC9_9PEZI